MEMDYTMKDDGNDATKRDIENMKNYKEISLPDLSLFLYKQ
jgi:hypothetical protein